MPSSLMRADGSTSPRRSLPGALSRVAASTPGPTEAQPITPGEDLTLCADPSRGAPAHVVPRTSRAPPPYHSSMTLAIADGLQVTLHYRMALEDGEVLDDTFLDEPFVFVQGDSGIVDGFERALAGLTPGEERSFTLSPAEAYGELDPDGDLTVERSQFPAGVDLRPGMTFRTEAGGSDMQIWVKAVTGDELVITRNHPLAGKAIDFQVRVVDVQEAAAEGAEPEDG